MQFIPHIKSKGDSAYCWLGTRGKCIWAQMSYVFFSRHEWSLLPIVGMSEPPHSCELLLKIKLVFPKFDCAQGICVE